MGNIYTYPKYTREQKSILVNKIIPEKVNFFIINSILEENIYPLANEIMKSIFGNFNSIDEMYLGGLTTGFITYYEIISDDLNKKDLLINYLSIMVDSINSIE